MIIDNLILPDFPDDGFKYKILIKSTTKSTGVIRYYLYTSEAKLGYCTKEFLLEKEPDMDIADELQHFLLKSNESLVNTYNLDNDNWELASDLDFYYHALASKNVDSIILQSNYDIRYIKDLGNFQYQKLNDNIYFKRTINDHYLFESNDALALANMIRQNLNITDTLTFSESVAKIKELSRHQSFPNGTEWTHSNIQSSNERICAIEYGNGMWVTSVDNNTYYSYDGKNWTLGTTNIPTFFDIKYANGIWVGGNGIQLNTDYVGSPTPISDHGIYYSIDGINWNPTNLINTVIEKYCGIGKIVYSNKMWLAFTGYFRTIYGYKGIYYSKDGLNWEYTEFDDSEGSFSYTRDIIYAQDKWIVAHDSGIYYSNDIITWNKTLLEGALNLFYSDGLCVACTTSGIYYSQDGINWTQSNITEPVLSTLPKNVFVHSKGIWLFLTSAGKLYKSNDGKNWEEIMHFEQENTEGVTNSISQAVGIWIVSNTDSIQYSLDGTNWITSNISSSIMEDCGCECIKNANGIWIIGTKNSGLWYSVTWEPQQLQQVEEVS